MTDNKSDKAGKNSDQKEAYSHGYDSKFVEYLEGRTITNDAAFLMPHLQAGINLLDCGCGPGAITIDLAEFVAPGPVTGIDIADGKTKIAINHESMKRSYMHFVLSLFRVFVIKFALRRI